MTYNKYYAIIEEDEVLIPALKQRRGMKDFTPADTPKKGLKNAEMLRLEAEMAQNSEALALIVEKTNRLETYKPTTDEGKIELSTVLERLEEAKASLRATIGGLRKDLEVATVKHLASDDWENPGVTMRSA